MGENKANLIISESGQIIEQNEITYDFFESRNSLR